MRLPSVSHKPDPVGASDDTAFVNSQSAVVGEGVEMVLVVQNLEIVR
jgi:hypothetical protein